MKCQQCDRPATFHITELTGPKPVELHLCEEHARDYLMGAEEKVEPVATMAGALAHHLKQVHAVPDLETLDQRTCPVCGITFYEFRHVGRLGCAHDYVAFDEELKRLIANIHGAIEHRGKHPKRGPQGTDELSELIHLRRQMREAVEREDYETASRLRDRIRELQRRARGG